LLRGLESDLVSYGAIFADATTLALTISQFILLLGDQAVE
jgi:hypothetical protein